MPKNSPNTKRYPMTTLDKINACLETIGDHAFHFVFMLDTLLDIDRFKRAMRLSMIAEPMFACRYVYNMWEPYWEEWDGEFLDRYEFCEVETLDPGEHTDNRMIAFFLETMDAECEPFVKVKILRGETDTLCMNINCVVADGSGMGAYIFKTLSIYNRLATEPDYMPTPADTSNRTTKRIMETLSVFDLIKLPVVGAQNHFLNKRTANNWEFPNTKNDEMKKTFVYRLFDQDVLDDLNRYRKKLDATVNDVMLAVYYRALFNVIKPKDVTKRFCVLNTYDLRRYLPKTVVPGAANYSSYINTNINFDDSVPFDEVVRRVQASIKEQKRNYPGLAEAPYVVTIFKALPFFLSMGLLKWLIKKRGGVVPVLTNAGSFDIRQVSIDGVPIRDGFPIGPLLYPPKLTVGLATTGRKILLCLGFSENHFKREDVERLFDNMGEIIKTEAAKMA